MLFRSLMGDFRRKYPAIQIQCDLLGRSQNILKGDYDIYFDISANLPSSAVAIRIDEFDMKLFASAKYLRENGFPKNLEDLVNHQLLSFSPGRTPITYWELTSEAQEQKVKIDINPGMVSNQPYAIKTAMLDDQGIALMPSVLMKAEVEDGELVNLFPDWHVPGLGVYMIYQKQKVRSPKVKPFVSFVKSEFNKYRHDF